MPTPELPKDFESLTPYAEAWVLENETQRWRRRLASNIEELEAFYAAANPRLPEMVEYLNRFPLDQLPEDASNLLSLTLSLIEIAPAVELLGQPDSRDAFEAARIAIAEAVERR